MADKATTRERILREASLLFAERGYHGTSTRDIADVVGIRQPSLFHHFESKQAIMAELQRLDIEPSIEHLAALTDLDVPASVRLYRYFHDDVRRLLEAPYHFISTHTPWVLQDAAFADARERFGELMDAQVRLIEQGIAAGEFVDADAVMVNRAIVSMVDGSLLDASAGGVPDVDTHAHLLATLALRSLLVDSSAVAAVREASDALPGA